MMATRRTTLHDPAGASPTTQEHNQRTTLKQSIAIDAALADKQLLGSALDDDLDSWSTWLTVLRAAFGLPLSPYDRKRFAQVAGERKPPTQPLQELWCAVGRRGGKSRVAAAIGVHAACCIDLRLPAFEYNRHAANVWPPS